MPELLRIDTSGVNLMLSYDDGLRRMAWRDGAQGWYVGPAPETPGPDPDPDPPTGDGWYYPMAEVRPWTTYSDGNGSHSGGAVDIGMGNGGTVPLLAPHSGPVLYAGWEGLGGNVIVIGGPDGEGLTFAHLNSMDVAVGDVVSGGQKIGMTGWTADPGGVIPPGPAGAHLHVEVRQNGVQWGPWHPAVQFYADRGIDFGPQA